MDQLLEVLVIDSETGEILDSVDIPDYILDICKICDAHIII